MCSVGYFKSSSLVNEQCKACAKGTYWSNITFCATCPTPDYTTSNEASTDISSCVCKPGAYRISNNPADGCGPCDLGQYSNGSSPSFCWNCPAGTYDILSTPKEQLGRSSSDICTPCPDNSYSSSKSASIASCKCNAGYWSKSGTGGFFSCIPCGPGRFSLQGAIVCTDCAIGYYSSASTASVCSQCLAPLKTATTGSYSPDDCVCTCGTYRDVARNLCIQCPAGKYGLGGDSICTPCPLANYTPIPGQCTCQGCKANAQAKDGMNCTCSPGYFNDGDLCSACPAGKFSRVNTDGTATCDPCLANTYNPNTKQTACTPCPDTSTAKAGVNTAVSVCTCGGVALQNNMCPSSTTPPPDDSGVGSVSGGGVVYIQACPAGQEPDPNNNKQSCRNCAAGMHKYLAPTLTDLNNCVCCPEGKYKPQAGTMECTACPANSSASTGGCGGLLVTSCLCNAGYYNNRAPDVTCAPCAPGTSSPAPGALLKCTDCSAGSYQSAPGTTTCIGCQSGSSTWNQSSRVFQALTGVSSGALCSCNDGYTKSNGVCSICLAGTYTVPYLHANQCVSCPAGTYSTAQGATTPSACLSCKAGSYSNITSVGATSITACKCFAGYTGPDGDYCTPCDLGTYKSIIGSSPCQACSVGSYQKASASTTCIACPGNAVTLTSSSQSATQCLCKPGYGYTDTPGGPNRFECNACAPGQYKNETSNTECIGCAQGTYNPGSAATSPQACIGCPDHSFTSAVVSVSQGYTSVNDCKCNKGFWALDPKNACTACSPGTYKDWYGTGQCQTCGFGFYQPTSSAEKPNTCIQCPPNTVTASDTNAANTSCQCKIGYSANCDGVACSRCAPGKYKSVVGSSMCTDCPLNTYNSLPGANNSNACLACPTDSVTLNNGSRLRSKCICGPGYTLASGSSGACVKCPQGYYKSTYSTDPCIPCPIASYASQLGMTACDHCQTNAVTANVGSVDASSCLCNPGYTGSLTCTACTAGQYKTALGSQSCTDCAVGFYSVHVALDSPDCLLCPYYSTTLSTGSKAVSACICTLGYFDTKQAPTKGPTCEACSRGTSRDDVSMSVCSKCPVGKYSTVIGSILSCTSCPQYMTTASSGSLTLADCECQVGYFRSDLANPLSCAPCQPGSYSDSLGPYPCDPCMISTYADNVGASTCSQCSPGLVTLDQGSDSLSDCQCDKGFEMIAGQCKPCALGKFKPLPGSSDMCAECPLNSYAQQQGSITCSSCALFASTPSTASSSSSQCGCIPGYYGSASVAGNPVAACLPCPVGSYKESRGSSACIVCPLNLTTAAAASISSLSCKPCNRGTVTQCTTFDCQCRPCSNCTARQFLVSPCNDTHDTVCSNCTGCVPGQYTEKPCDFLGPGVCTCCQAGTYSVVGSVSVCQVCPPSTYSTGSCATSCSICQNGNYQTGPGKTSCTPCEQGKYQPYFNNNCTFCSEGTYQSETGKTYCSDCEAGKYSTGIGIPDPKKCTCCSANEYQSQSGRSSCIHCAQGTYSYDTCCASASCCKSCQTWNLSCSAPDKQCGSSAFRYESTGVPLVSAWRATSWQVGLCPPCQAGKYFLFDPVNTENPSQASVPYPTLQFSPEKIRSKSSGGLKFIDVTTSDNTKVDFSVTIAQELGLQFANLLQENKTSSHIGLQYSVLSTGPSSLQLQLKTFVGDGEFRNALQLPVFRFGLYGLNSTKASLRVFRADGLFGFLSGTDLFVQESDADVLFQYLGVDSSAADTGIILYFAGTSSVTLKIETSVDQLPSDPCFIAIDGDVSIVRETDFEKMPPINPTLLSVACRCASCSSGKFSTKIGAMAEYDCAHCNAGQYSADQNATVCRDCPLGTYRQYSGAAGKDACLACDSGGYSSSVGSTACTVCDAGLYTGILGATSVSNCSKTCPDGQYLAEGKSCTNCAAGTFSKNGQGCQPCLSGTYSALPGSTFCFSCGTGSYAFYSGASSCISIQDLTNAVSAVLICPDCKNYGSYYTPCAKGSYATDLAATVCSLCGAGTYASAEGSGVCKLCSPGQYAKSGASACTQCPSGTYTSAIGSTSSADCITSTSGVAAGTFLPTTSPAGPAATIVDSGPSSSVPSCETEGADQVGNFLCSGGECLKLPK